MGFQLRCIVFVVSLIAFADAQAPKPCCVPRVFSTGLATLTQTPAQQGQPSQLVSQEGMYYFDGPNNRTAANVTVQYLYSGQPTQQVYEIQDYVKKMMYIIIDNKTCMKTPLSGDFPSNDCIPDDAKFQGSIKLGESYPVNRWLIDAASVTQDVTMTVDKCVPVTSALIVQQDGITVSSQQYYNFKSSIDNPDEKFTPPSICKNAKIGDTGADVKSSQKPFVL